MVKIVFPLNESRHPVEKESMKRYDKREKLVP
jgi:hypothetical protein